MKYPTNNAVGLWFIGFAIAVVGVIAWMLVKTIINL